MPWVMLPGAAKKEPQEDPWVRLGKMGDDIASKVEIAVERFSRSLERTVREKLTKLPEFLAKFPFGGSEETQEFTQVVRGPVGPGGGPTGRPEQRERTHPPAGLVRGLLSAHSGAEGEGADRELLRSRLFAVDWEDDAVRDDFRLSVPGFEDRSISLHLLVPESRTYEVKLVSKNGSLGVENLKGNHGACEDGERIHGAAFGAGWSNPGLGKSTTALAKWKGSRQRRSATSCTTVPTACPCLHPPVI